MRLGSCHPVKDEGLAAVKGLETQQGWNPEYRKLAKIVTGIVKYSPSADSALPGVEW